jgi:hypothetical protein
VLPVITLEPSLPCTWSSALKLPLPAWRLRAYLDTKEELQRTIANE